MGSNNRKYHWIKYPITAYTIITGVWLFVTPFNLFVIIAFYIGMIGMFAHHRPVSWLSKRLQFWGLLTLGAIHAVGMTAGVWFVAVFIALFSGHLSNDKVTSKPSTMNQSTVNNRKDIKIISAAMRPYKQEERGKFIDICFNRNLESYRDNYNLQLYFTSYDQCGSENCNKKIYMSIGILDKDKSCLSYNVYLSNSRKYNSETWEEYHMKNDFIDNKLVKNNIKSLEITIYDQGALIDKKVFSNL